MSESRQPYPIVGGEALPRHRVVKAGSGSKMDLVDAKTERPLGVTHGRSTGAADKGSAIYVHGICKATASAAIVQDAQLMAVAGGKVATHDGLAGSYYLGRALEAATGDGHEFEILLYDNPYPEPA